LYQAIDICRAAGQPVYVNTLRLVMATIYQRENQPAKVIALLDQIAPELKANRFYAHMESAEEHRAQALLMLGRPTEAKTAALAVLSMSDPGEISETLRDAYEVLYKIEKKRGNAAAALSYIEHYAAQDKGYLDDVSARALAYQTVQQHLLTEKLETEKLSKQNTMLRLQ